VGQLERMVKWARRHPAWASFFILGLLSLVGFALGYWQLRQAYADLSISQKESDKHLQAARTVLNNVVNQYTNELSLIPQTEQMRLKGLAEARELYEGLIGIRPRDEQSRAQYADSCQKLAEIERTLNRFDKASAAYIKASEQLEALLKDTNKSEYAWKLLSLKVQQCKLEQDQQHTEEYDRHYQEASQIAARLALRSKEDIHIASALAQYFTLAGQQLRREQKLVDSEKMYRAALEQRQQAIAGLGQGQPVPLDFQEGLAMAHNNVATSLLIQQKYEEAAQQITKAIETLPTEKSPRMLNTLAMFQSNQAVVREQLKQWDPAWQAYEQAAATFQQLSTDYPMVPDYRFRWAKVKLNMIRSMLAIDYQRTKQPLAEVEPVLEELVKSYPQQPQYQEQWKILKVGKELYAEQARTKK
jgi:hypothetical protein